MPNKRKKGKKLVAGWLPEQEVDEFKARANEMGITATDLLTLLIREEMRRTRPAPLHTKNPKTRKDTK
jgi:vacuolar-type H+-ATPase subunit I/STV1